MRTVKLLSWASDVDAKAMLLTRAKTRVDAAPLVRTSAVVGELARMNPAALVLDLDRLPSNAREISLMLRASRSARHIPILLAGSLPSTGAVPEKYGRLRSELPDIPYAAWADVCGVLSKVLEQPATSSSIVPQPRVYTASLAQKLGVLPGENKPGASKVKATKAGAKPRQVALMGAPDGFIEMLGDLPETVTFATQMTGATTLAVCFIRSLDELKALLDLLKLRLPLAASA